MLKERIRKVMTKMKHEVKQLKLIIQKSFYIKKSLKNEIVDNFHRLYYDSRLLGKTHGNAFWLGTPVYKCPMDLLIYQEIIFDTKPDIIIETGTMDGGSALFMASVCDLIKHGKVFSIDIEHRNSLPKHDRITYLLGSSVSDDTIRRMRNLIKDHDKIMVVLDSDHRMEHVLKELEIYCNFVTIGNYLIVEDTNMSGHPVAQEFGAGPMEALEEFMKTNKQFMIDKEKETHLLTFNPNGYLKRTN